MPTLSIPSLPWHGLTLRLVPGLLSKKGHSVDEYQGTIVALPAPAEGRVLEVGFILAEGPGIAIDGAHFAIGQVVSGGRALVAVARYAPHDTAKIAQEAKDLVKQVPVPAKAAERADPGDEYAMHLFGMDAGVMTVTEVHNVRYKPHQKAD
jgi:hypothetical protein